jgi:hypothetical protein
MLDQQDRHPVATDALDQHAQGFGFGAVHPGCRLVERQQLGFGGQCAGNLEASLVAVGKMFCIVVRARVNADVVQEFFGATSNRRLFGTRRRIANDRAEDAGARAQVAPNHDVLEGRHVPEQANVLKRAGNPDGGGLVRRIRLKSDPVKDEVAALVLGKDRSGN